MSTFAVDVKVLLQFFSSELSTQSFTWSHSYCLGIHWPSWQVNWSDLHVCPPGRESFLLTLFSKNSFDSSQEPCISSAYHRFFVHPSRRRSLRPHRRQTQRRCIPRLSHTWIPASCTMAVLPRAQNNKQVNSFAIVMIAPSYGSDSRQSYTVFLYSDILKPQSVGWKKQQLTTVLLIWVVAAVVCPVTPPLYVDALSVGALKLPAAAASCRIRKKKTLKKKKHH